MNSQLAIIPPEVTACNGRVITTSKAVSDYFGKRHDDVLKKIRNLDCSPEFHARNFAEVVRNVPGGDGAIRKMPAYQITRDGFAFLGMGFTGKKAAQFKENYIDAFNKMEAELLSRKTERELRSGEANPPAGQDTYRIINTYRSCDNVLIGTRLVAPDEQLNTPQAAAQYVQRLMKKQGVIMIREVDLAKISY